jgi:hypothetical protein
VKFQDARQRTARILKRVGISRAEATRDTALCHAAPTDHCAVGH